MVLWITRILFAPNHFKLPLHTRLYYCIFGGYMVDQAALYDFKHNDKKQYLSEFDWYRSRKINGIYSEMLNNKVVFTQIIERYCKTPEIYCIKRKTRLAGMNGRVIGEYDDLIKLLYEVGAYVIKPVHAGKGNGVFVVRYNGHGIICNDEPVTESELKDLLQTRREWLICAYAHQAEYLNKIYANSANTLRMIVLRNAETKEFELCFAVQRIGADWTGSVDNGSRGGLVANVDIETGKMSYARTLHNLTVYRTHPDSNAQIEGAVIPNWDNIKASVLDVSRNFPYLDIIAWDILPTDDGFTVIEANTSSGVNIIQLWGPQRYGRLGDFYREHNIIK
jgi:hypothetical protein